MQLLRVHSALAVKIVVLLLGILTIIVERSFLYGDNLMI